MEKYLTNKYIMVFAAMISCALWGAAIPLVKISYRMMNINVTDYGNQIVFAGIRFFLAGIMVIIFRTCTGLAKKDNKVYIKSKSVDIHSFLIKTLILCLFQTVGQYIPYYLGIVRTSGVSSSILVSTNAFFAVIISSLILHQESLTIKKAFGCIAGLAGVIAISVIGNESNVSFEIVGNALILLSACMSACSSIYVKRCSKEYDSILLCGSQFSLGGVILTVIGYILGGEIMINDSFTFLLLICLAMISAVAFSIWSMLLKVNEVSKVTVNGFMIPVFGVLYSIIMLKEAGKVSITAVIISLTCICAGIVIENK